MITVVCTSRDRAFPDRVREAFEPEGGMQVVPARSGSEALALLASLPCDAVVSDMVLEDMDGIALLKAVRERSRIPFILVAGPESVGREDDAFVAGADYFFIRDPDPAGSGTHFRRIARWIRLAVTRNRDEAGLREREARYRELVENANLIIMKLDRDSRITYFNAFACTFFGVDEQDVIGRPLAETIVSATTTDPALEMDYFIHDTGPRSDRNTARETEHVKKDGTRVWISWRIKPILDRDNTVSGVIRYGTDMTERRKAEQALFRANQRLNLLNRITRHDILNQLTILGGYIVMSRELAHDAEMRGYIGNEKKATNAIRSMIKFTKDYQDIGLYRPQWQYLRNIVSLLSSTVDFGHVALKNELGRLEIYADPLFEKVVYTLMENAIRHGGPLTVIRLSYHLDHAGCSILCEDDGVGIPEEEKEKIFLREYGKHTGFGLFLAREILGITGFSIRETGTPGKGARFEILVPAGSFRENKEE